MVLLPGIDRCYGEMAYAWMRQPDENVPQHIPMELRR